MKRKNYIEQKIVETELKNKIEQTAKINAELDQENKINEQQIRNHTHTNGLHYCKKCGRVVLIIADKTGYADDTCDYCKSKVYPVPEKYWLNGKSSLISNEQEKLLREELVKTSPDFDEYLFSHRDHDLAERTAKIYAALEHGRAVLEGRGKGNKFGVACPYCKATNVRKITITNKAIHTSIFGIWSIGRNAKQWHCDHCGSDF